MSIEFEAKTDRELLILAVQKCNEGTEHLKRINGKLTDHEKRLYHLEHNGYKHLPFQINWQAITIIAGVVALIIVAIGNNVGWW